MCIYLYGVTQRPHNKEGMSLSASLTVTVGVHGVEISLVMDDQNVSTLQRCERLLRFDQFFFFAHEMKPPGLLLLLLHDRRLRD